MRIARFIPLAAISLAAGIWSGGTAFAGGAYGSASPRVETGPSSVETIKPAHYKKRQYRRHNRKRHFRSHRRHRHGRSYRYRPYFSYRRSYYGYGYYRPYGHYRPYFGYRHGW